MSDYYYFKDKDDEWGLTLVLGEDYIRALKSIARKHGVKITDKMVLKEIYGEQVASKRPKTKTKKGKVGIWDYK